MFMKTRLSQLLPCLVTALLAASSNYAIAQSSHDAARLTISASAGGKSVDASCVLKNDKGVWEIKQTPAQPDLILGDNPLVITCSKRGSNDGVLVLLKPHTPENGSSTGSLIGASAFGLIGGLIGGAVDSKASTSATEHPTTLNIQLGKTVILGDLVPEALKSQGDFDLEYGVMESSEALKLSLSYSKYQFVPDRDAVKQVCISQIKRIAETYASDHNKFLANLADSEPKVSTRRNGGLGMTYCQATLTVSYVEQSTPPQPMSTTTPILGNSGKGQR